VCGSSRSNSSTSAGGSMFRLRFVLSQHVSGCHLLSFSPDSCWLVSVSSSGPAGSSSSSIVLWDVHTGEAAAIGRTSRVSQCLQWERRAAWPSSSDRSAPGMMSFSQYRVRRTSLTHHTRSIHALSSRAVCHLSAALALFACRSWGLPTTEQAIIVEP
jgi:WD40 repeat protein